MHISSTLRDVARRGGAALAAVSAISLAVLAPVTASAEEYRLGAGDILKIKVVEWQTIEGTFRDWSSVNGDYVVGPSGSLAVPLLGELPTAGKTTSEIASEIGAMLQQRLGLADRPEAAVGIAEYRPIFISGVVQAPGKYPFIPGLTVLKATTIAGGLQRDASASQRFERDFIAAQGSYAVSVDAQRRLLVKRARIAAEVAGKPKFEVPPELAADTEAGTIVADEQAIMTARQNKLALQLQALDDLRALLEKEIEALDKKKASQQSQLELAEKELGSVGSLADQGLVVNTRVIQVKKSIAEIQSSLLDIDTSILRARQDINKAEQDAINFRNTHDSDLALERQQVEAELNETNLKLATQQGLMGEAVRKSPQSQGDAGFAPEMSYAIVRTVDGKTAETAAGEETAVLPGDVIKVSVALPVGQ